MSKESQRIARRIFIYPKFQLSLILINVGVLILAFGILVFQNHSLFTKLHEMGVQAGMSEDHPFQQFIHFQESQFQLLVMTSLAVVLCLFVLVSLVISHRVAGPISRLRAFFEEMEKTGNVSELSFRESDFFDDLPKVVNRSLRSISKGKG